jgi:hypothetical protein
MRRIPVHREVRPSKAPPVVYARDGAGNSRSICAFASRILGSTDLGSTAIKCHFGFKNKKGTFQIHHIALSANALFRLTLPRSVSRHNPPDRRWRAEGECPYDSLRSVGDHESSPRVCMGIFSTPRERRSGRRVETLFPLAFSRPRYCPSRY